MNAPRNHFPRTPRTVVFEALEQGQVHQLSGELMRLYALPLEIYFSATSFRNLGAPSDIVAGFFASRFSQPDWLPDWRVRHQTDQIPLRRWLLTSLNFYLHEELRRQRRDRREGAHNSEALSEALSEARASADYDDSAERRFEREAARAVVGEALERTREASIAAGQSVHLEVFMRHFIGQEPYETLGPEFGLGVTQCAGYTRTVAAKFRRALAEILVREGADPNDLDGEIGRLMEALVA